MTLDELALIPPLREYQMCRALRVSWRELQEMPESVLDLWMAFNAGEAEAAKTAGK